MYSIAEIMGMNRFVTLQWGGEGTKMILLFLQRSLCAPMNVYAVREGRGFF